MPQLASGACSGASVAGGLLHRFGDDADAVDARALGDINHLDDVLVAQCACAHDVHRLVSAIAVDRPQPLLELLNSGRQSVDGDVAISRARRQLDLPHSDN